MPDETATSKLELDFLVHSALPVDADTARAVFLVPDYLDEPTRKVLGVSESNARRNVVADPSKFVLNEVHGAAALTKGRRVKVTLEWDDQPVDGE